VTKLADILGQEGAVDSIRRAYRAGRLAHGLIFAGPAGVGKATTARALAGLFLCAHPKDDVPCGQCASCTVMGSGNHPDYHVITKELIRYHDKTGKSKGIDLSLNVLRPELIEPAGRKAMMNHGKVFIIEQAELMNTQAQNAILKTLEEPAGQTLIILLTDQPGALLPTIRSRCQIVRFAALAPELVAKQLAGRGIDAKTAASASAFAEGSLGLALKWIEDGVIDAAGQLAAQVEQLLAGRGCAADLPDWFKAAAESYAQKQMERDPLSSKDQATREGLGLYLHIAGNTMRRKLAATDDPERLEQICAGIDALARAEMYLDANVNIPLTFQQLAVTLERQLA
jgi:DNA polymerase-3 subunit delta'